MTDPTKTAAHPLEPLTAEEITEAVATIRKHADLGDAARFAYITLNEPPKETVLGFVAGDPVDREAFAVVFDRATAKTYEAVVSVSKGEVRSWNDVPGVQPLILIEEMMMAFEAVKADERYRAALERRGITDLDKVSNDPWSAGNYTSEVEPGRRVVRVLSYLRNHPEDNQYAHPIEGLIADVDLLNFEVLAVHDYGEVPVPEADGNYDQESVGVVRTDLKPLDIVQPEGASFEVSGNEVRWQRWSFRVSMHPLDGLVLHTVGYADGGRVRPILYRAGLAEMVVPYAETSPGHRWKNVFDAGEYGIGRFPFVNSLEVGCDCLGTIHYLEAVAAAESGDPIPIPNAICIHEEDAGILWKHWDFVSGKTEVRRSRRLVVSSVHTVGNYEYGFYWYFYQDGTIQLEIKFTGILQTMAVPPGEAPAQGELVAPNLGAPHHQHLFCYRLDFDVDGLNNSIEETEAALVAEGADNPYGAAWAATTRVLSTESEAQRVADPAKGRQWKIVNPGVSNALGRPTAYRLIPSASPTLLAHAGSVAAKRAGFATKNLWVTPYAPSERRAAGDYPNLARNGSGLPEWTAADRSVENTDLVVWYVVGLTHIARPEDWPVMPVELAGFTLKPAGFFDRNPALDVPAHTSGHHEQGS
ncbi:MAG: primary-amine oxidase [Actinomycetota bacterium]